jgi:hypothetical protein
MITKTLPIVFHIEPRMKYTFEHITQYTFEHITQSLQRMSFCACGQLQAFPIYHQGHETKSDHIRPMYIRDHIDGTFRVKVHGPRSITPFEGKPVIAQL